jgi:diaminopimelate decarboxylase
MTTFRYVDGTLCAEGVPLAEIAAKVGTPCYVYSRRQIDAQWRAFDVADRKSVV